jgi:DNA-binding NtrC family response regulator
VKGFTKEAVAALMEMPWEGNVRELENIIERAIVLARGEEIDLTDLPSHERGDVDSFLASVQSGALPTLDEIERRYMKFVLDKTGGRKEKAAQILGVNRRTLYRKEREYGFVSDTDVEENAQDGDGASAIE